MMMTRRVGHYQIKKRECTHVQEIDISMLTDPLFNGERQECYLGRGSFGLVKLQLYCGIYIAVKELLPRSVGGCQA